MKIGTRARNALALKACKEVYMLVVCVIALDVEIENTTCWKLKMVRQYKSSKESKEGRRHMKHGERKKNVEVKYRTVMI
jgi:hypothetical protein